MCTHMAQKADKDYQFRLTYIFCAHRLTLVDFGGGRGERCTVGFGALDNCFFGVKQIVWTVGMRFLLSG